MRRGRDTEPEHEGLGIDAGFVETTADRGIRSGYVLEVVGVLAT